MGEPESLDKRIAALEEQISRLNQALSATAKPKAVDISADDVASFHKVRDALAGGDWGEFCGINDCFRPRPCLVQPCVVACRPCIVQCINECTCGPCRACAIDPATLGNIGRFQQFG